MQFLVLLLAIPLLVCAYDGDSHDENLNYPRVLDIIREISDVTRETLISAPNKPIDTRTANFVYNLMLNIIKKKLTPVIEVPVMGEPGGMLYVENATIFGANETYINIDGPKSGYNIDNFTLYIPSLDIYADKYTINDLEIVGIKLNGEGALHIYLENIQVYAKMEISFENLGFVVQSITALTFSIESSKFELTNLGGSGEEVSSLLNDIASQLLAKLVRSASNELTEIINNAGGRCTDSSLGLVCDIISSVLTYLKNNLI